MRAGVRGPAIAAMSVLMLFIAWRIVSAAWADHLAPACAECALRWRPQHPDALLEVARQQQAEGHKREAAATARRLLAAEPLQGEAFAVLAAAQDDAPRRTQALYAIAVRRAPRDVHARAWITDQLLQQGQYAKALAQIDTLLRVAPSSRAQLYPALAQLTGHPGFAEALVQALLEKPEWRGGLLEYLSTKADPAVRSRVLGPLQKAGGLSPEEFDRWLTLLIRQNHWGEAYSRWAGSLALDGAPLPAVYNGGFVTAPSSSGFDWWTDHVPGVRLAFAPAPGAEGLAAHAHFAGRPVAQVGLAQPLLLAPGRYRLTARMQARSLEAEFGLEWQLVCAGRPLVASQRIRGSFPWQPITGTFSIPEDCPGQWLRLRNAAPGGVGQRLSGDLWIDSVAITQLSPSNG